MHEVSAEANGGEIMIRNEQIMSVIEKHRVQAKLATTNGEMREQLVAIKALCDVLLMNDVDSSIKKPVQGGVVSSINKPVQTSGIVQPINNQVQVLPSQPISSSSKLDEEDGANGDSIFDF